MKWKQEIWLKPETKEVKTPEDRAALLKRIDAALKRMREDYGLSEANEHYQSLLRKRELVASGEPVVLRQMNAELIGPVGAALGRLARTMRNPGVEEMMRLGKKQKA